MLAQRKGLWAFCLVATLCFFVLSGASDINSRDGWNQRFRRASGDKIYYGSDAKLKEFPFVVYTNSSELFQVCTGSLIHRQWVLIAGHCLFFNTHVVLGDYNRPGNDGTEQVIAIAEEIRHPEYDATVWLHNDVGLIKLAEPANIRSDAVAKISPLKSKAFMKKMLANEKSCMMLGWGLMKSPDGSIFDANRLQKLPTRFVNETEAAERNYNTYQSIGAIATEPIYKDKCGRGSVCFGDSGGPVVCKQKGTWVQTGINAFIDEFGTCQLGVNGVVNVQLYYDWIQSVISQ